MVSKKYENDFFSPEELDLYIVCNVCVSVCVFVCVCFVCDWSAEPRT